jgi:hypothetical protein
MNKILLHRISKINTYIFPSLVLLTFLFLGIETYTYLGALEKHFYVNSRLFLAIATFSAILITNKENIVFKLNKYIFPLLLIFYLAIMFFEVRYYPNYIFSFIHLQPQVFVYLVFFSGILLLIENLKNKWLTAKVQKSTSVTKMLVMFILLYLISDGTLKVVNQAIYADFGMITHINFNYDDKMRSLWGFYHDYIKFVGMNTENDSSILVPPQSFNSTAGNVGLDRYFLYPRTLENGSLNELSATGYDYVLLTPGWPKDKLLASKIIYFDKKTYSVSEVEGNYDPSKISEESWGIIVIKK